MVVRMRHTRAHTRNRRSHHALKEPALSTCGNCGAFTRPHHMCQACGYYKGRQVLDLTTLKAARDARIKAKRDQIRVESGAPKEAVTEQVHEDAGEKAEKIIKGGRAVTTGTSSKKQKKESS